MSDLYDTDILIWSERQADLLRRHAAGEWVSDQVDWANVAEEIESVGRGQLGAIVDLLVEALRHMHMLKLEAWPLSHGAPSWREDADVSLREARRRFTPGMRQRIGNAVLYREALAGMPEMIDGLAPLPVSDVCPVTLDEVLRGD